MPEPVTPAYQLPTREQVEEWEKAAETHARTEYPRPTAIALGLTLDKWERAWDLAKAEYIARLAFSAGASSRPVLDIPAILADPALSRLRDWYAIGPAQRAEVDTLVEWVRMRERERAARVCETIRRTNTLSQNSILMTCAAAIRRGEG